MKIITNVEITGHTFKLSMSQRGTFKGNLKSSLNLMKIKAQQINVCQIQLNQQCEKCL